MHLPSEEVYNFRIWSSQPNYQELIRIGGRLAKLSALCSLSPEADLDDPSRVSNYGDDNPRNPPPRLPCNLSLYSGRNEGREIRRSWETMRNPSTLASPTPSRGNLGWWGLKEGGGGVVRSATVENGISIVRTMGHTVEGKGNVGGSIGVKEEQRASVLLSWDIKRSQRWTRLLKKPSLPFFCAPLKGEGLGSSWHFGMESSSRVARFCDFFFLCKWNLH